MLFSSPTFLFFFLPLTLVFYFLTPWRNVALLLLSLVFYAWGEPFFIFLLLAVIVFNHRVGLAIGVSAAAKSRKRRLVLGVVGNISTLVVFKYLDFLGEAVNALLSSSGRDGWPLPHLPLPLGISFFIFQGVSYLIDVYRKTIPAEPSLIRVALFKSFFTQLIAGPIVRYGEMSSDLKHRRVTVRDGIEGTELFIVGLAKKVLIADTLAVPADLIMQQPVAGLAAPLAWLGILCFSLQIYFDFSGYTDMARGLGRVFGFHFPENFRHPYAARSVQDFWRRWHMTLSRWFRDYLYIPLGGSRGGSWRTSLNLWIVFGLCGLWHGASWNFVVWGFWHGAFLVLERTPFGTWLQRAPGGVRHVYLLVTVSIGWVFFRSPTLSHSMGYLDQMMFGGGWDTAFDLLRQTMSYYQLTVFVIGVVASFPVAAWGASRLKSITGPGRLALESTRTLGLLAILALSFGAVSSTTLQSFIYFRF